MALIFPTNPNSGDTFTAQNGYTYLWDGYKWGAVPGGTTNTLRLYNTEESIAVITSATGVVNHDCSVRNIFVHQNIQSDFVVNLTNFTLHTGYGTAVTLVLQQGNSPASIQGLQINGTTATIYWASGIQPTGDSNSIDALSFSIVSASTGSYLVLGQQIAFA
jgi:hypothetical protein